MRVSAGSMELAVIGMSSVTGFHEEVPIEAKVTALPFSCGSHVLAAVA